MSARPLRSVLYIPGSKPRALDKARSLPVDAIIFDLKDAVAPSEKDAARANVVDALAEGGFGARLRILRINGLDTPWGRADLDTRGPDALLIPKVNTPADIAAVRQATDLPIWAMMETAEGILNAQAIAKAPGIGGFVMGTNDFAKELGSRTRDAMATALQHCLLAARAGGIPCLDDVYNAFKDDDGLRAECTQGRDWGMDGKTLVHPAQIAATNEVFAPSEAEIDLARRQIEAFAAAKGEGVVVVDGKIVENLHIETARATLAKATAIAAMETG